MKKYPIIIHSQFIYVRLQAIIWKGNGLKSPNVMQSDAGDILKDIFNTYKDLPILINCKEVFRIENYTIEWIESISNSFLFFECERIKEDLKKYITEYHISTEYNGTLTNDSSLVDKINSALKEEDYFIENSIKACFKYNKNRALKRLKSTPIKSNGIYNARSIIKDPNTLALVTIRYADIVRETISDKKSLSPTILAVSLRACSFAKSIASLTKSKIELVDHFGPSLKIYEKLALIFHKKSTDYFLISDFIIGGSELKSAITYAHLKRGDLNTVLTLGHLLDQEDYNIKVDIISLTNKKLNQLNEVVYEI